jgi:hypothetical protein
VGAVPAPDHWDIRSEVVWMLISAVAGMVMAAILP